jgi:hypothetical protein
VGAAKSGAAGGAEAGKERAESSFAPGEMDGGRAPTARPTRKLGGCAAQIGAARIFFKWRSDAGSERSIFHPPNRKSVVIMRMRVC